MICLCYYNKTTINIHNHLNISTTLLYMYFKFCTRNKTEPTERKGERKGKRTNDDDEDDDGASGDDENKKQIRRKRKCDG